MILRETSLLKYSTHWESDGVFVQITGIVTVEETFILVQSILTDPRFKNCRYRIYDFTGILRIDQDENSLKSQAAISKSGSFSLKRRTHQIAFVGKNTDHHRRLFQTYSKYMSSPNFELRFFQTIEKAREWTHSFGSPASRPLF